MAKARLELGADVGSGAECEQVHDLVVGEVVAVLYQSFHQPDGLGRSRADEDPVAGGNARNRLFRGRELVPVAGLPVGGHVPDPSRGSPPGRDEEYIP